MITTSPDGQWAAVRRGREVSLLAAGAGPVTSRIELETDDADLVIVGPPSVLAVVTRGPGLDRMVLYQPPYLDAVARLDLDTTMQIAAVTGPRVALVSRDGKAVTIVRIAGRGLSSQGLETGSPVEFAVGLERNQILFGLLRKLEAWDAVSGRPLLRMQLQLPPPPRTVGPAHGHVWATRPGSDIILLWRLSDGRPFRHQVGAPIEDVIYHAASPLLILVTERGLVRLHCFAHSLTLIDAPWQPGTALAQLVVGEDINLLGVTEDRDEPWRVPIGGAGAPAVTLDSPDAPSEPPLTTAADKLRAMRERSHPVAASDSEPALPAPTHPGGRSEGAAFHAGPGGRSEAAAHAGPGGRGEAAPHARTGGRGEAAPYAGTGGRGEAAPHARTGGRSEGAAFHAGPSGRSEGADFHVGPGGRSEGAAFHAGPSGRREGADFHVEPGGRSEGAAFHAGPGGRSEGADFHVGPGGRSAAAAHMGPGGRSEGAAFHAGPGGRSEGAAFHAGPGGRGESVARGAGTVAGKLASLGRSGAAARSGERTRSWREPLAAFGAELVRGAEAELPVVAADTELGQLAQILQLTAAARRALVALYGLYLVGEPALPIARLAGVIGDWSEPLGQGELGTLAVLRRRGGRVALRGAVSDVLDGVAPRAVRLVGDGAAAPRPGAFQLEREDRSDAVLETELAEELGRIAVIEGGAALGVLEARLRGATAVAMSPPAARPAPWPRGAALIVVAPADTDVAWVSALPPFTAA